MFTQVLKPNAKLQQPIPGDIDTALNALVKLSGISKRSIVAEALRCYLVEQGVLPATSQPIQPTLARGVLAADRKERTR